MGGGEGIYLSSINSTRFLTNKMTERAIYLKDFFTYNSPGAGAVLFLKGRSRSRRKSGGSATLQIGFDYDWFSRSFVGELSLTRDLWLQDKRYTGEVA